MPPIPLRRRVYIAPYTSTPQPPDLVFALNISKETHPSCGDARRLRFIRNARSRWRPDHTAVKVRLYTRKIGIITAHTSGPTSTAFEWRNGRTTDINPTRKPKRNSDTSHGSRIVNEVLDLPRNCKKATSMLPRRHFNNAT